MSHAYSRTLVRFALLPAAVLMALSGSVAAFADGSGAARSGSAASAQHQVRYTMHLSSRAATVPAGGTTETTISFRASRRLYGAPVDLSVSGLPDGVTASFAPSHPRVGGTSTLTLTTAPGSSTGAFAVTVNAIINEGVDPIGTSATFDLTVAAR